MDKKRQSMRRALAKLGAAPCPAAITTITPMLAETSARPFTRAGWLFELKYDGYRLLAHRAADQTVRLRYRGGSDATRDFPAVALAVADLPFAPLVLDGEVVALDPSGRPSFGLLQQRAMPAPTLRAAALRRAWAARTSAAPRPLAAASAPRGSSAGGEAPPALGCAGERGAEGGVQGTEGGKAPGGAAAPPGGGGGRGVAVPIVFFAFDVLVCEGYDLRPLPLAERRRVFSQVMAAAGQEGVLRAGEAIEERGEDLWAAVAALGLEGIVAKRAASPYRAGRSADWLKVRADQVGDFVIVGYGLSAPGGLSAGRAPADLRRLHLAAWAGTGYQYVGSVGSGLAAGSRALLSAWLAAASAMPVQRAGLSWLAGAPRSDARSSWIAPHLVCEVRYKEWTSAGNLRQPVFLRLRDDKRPRECLVPAVPSPIG